MHLIFWGSAWLAWPPPNATVGACTDAVVTILASDYMNSLTQYSVGSGSLGSVTVVSDSVGGSPADPPNPFSNNDVWQLVEHLRAAGQIPTGDIGASGQGLYMVVMPAGVGSNQAGVIGEHSYYWFGSPATNVPFGWVTQDSVDSFSVVFSHELVESCTDPEGDGLDECYRLRRRSRRVVRDRRRLPGQRRSRAWRLGATVLVERGQSVRRA